MDAEIIFFVFKLVVGLAVTFAIGSYMYGDGEVRRD